eukprot:Hpha_TRINITY_DN16800_c1_g3::TRINITY_DN16800_c1_g3_i1::g.152070::m.152070
MLRFMALGPVASSLQPLERLAARWKQETVVDASTHAWIEGRAFIAIAVVMLPKRSTTPIPLYSLVPSLTESPTHEDASHDNTSPLSGRARIYEDSITRIAAYQQESQSRVEEAVELIEAQDGGDDMLLSGECEPWIVRDVGLHHIRRRLS